MKLIHLTAKTSAFTMIVAGALAVTGCADGYDSPEGFDLGVRNAQMESPDSISFLVSTDGESATVSWAVVPGAQGHEVTFMNVDDPQNPVIVDGYDKKIVDGSKFTVTVAEDSKYQMLIRTLGNKNLNNKDAVEAKTFDFSTLVPSVMTIPSGSDIYEYIQEHPLDSVGGEVAIDLEPGGTYTLTGQVDFRYQQLTFRGDKVNWPTVNVVGNGSFATYGGLKFKFLKVDMTEATAQSFIFMSPNPPDEIKCENLPGYVGEKLSKGTYMVEQPVYLAHCWFKNLPHSMLHDNSVNCAFWYFTVSDCIVQMNNTTNSNVGFVNLYQAGKSVKNILIEKSTIYNIVDNDAACFIRYQNESNSQPEKTYGTFNSEYQSHGWKFLNSTLAKCYTGWRFCNNVRGNDFTLNIDHTIFYNVAQLYRMTGMGSKTFRFNFFWNDKQDDKDRNNSATDTNKAPFASEYEPQFGGNSEATVAQELDLTKPNGGVDFTPKEYQIVMNRAGDPRWLPSAASTEE